MQRTPPSLITLALLSAVSMLTLNMILPSLPSMARDLAAREAVVALAVSGYMLVAALFLLTLGPLSDRFGRRRVMLLALCIYLGASLGCTLASDVTTLLICRVLQGVIVAGAVVSSAVIRDQYSAHESAGKMGAISAATAVGPMLAPILGGLLDGALGWRSIFALYTALGAVLLVLVWFDMGETRAPGQPAARQADWGALLASGRYWAYVLCSAFSVGAFYVFVTGVPYVATQQWQLTPAQVGLGLGSITGGFMLGASITARLAPRRGIYGLIWVGRWVPTLALSLALLLFAAGVSNPLALFGLTVFVGLGNGLTLSNANAGALSVRPDLAGTAAGLAGALSIALGAVLSGLTALAVERWATPALLTTLMLGCVLLSLMAARVAIRLDPAAPGLQPARA
jgi:DHA1 family bicyclomycin/chloramphenicol resistance-like MFS transporter